MGIHNSDTAAEAACENVTSLIVHDHGGDFSQVDLKEKDNETSEIPAIVGKDSADVLFDVPFVGVLEEEKPTPERRRVSNDSDEFNRWEAGQILAQKLMLNLVDDFQSNKPLVLKSNFVARKRSLPWLQTHEPCLALFAAAYIHMSCTTTAKSTHTSIFLVLPADHHVIIIIMPTNHRAKTLQPHSIKPCTCSLLIHLAMRHAFIQHDNKQEANTNVSHHLQEYQLATNQEISKISDLQIQEPAVPCRQCEQESMCARKMPLNTWFVSVVTTCYKSTVQPVSKDSGEQFSKALNCFQREDPTFRVGLDPENGQTIISGMGEPHLDIYDERSVREYKVDAVGKPRVNFRETVTQHADLDYLHKKQSGGRGQYGRVIGYIEPLLTESGTKLEFESMRVGQAVPSNFVLAIEKAANSCALIGHPVENLRVVLTVGAAHVVDSSKLAFKMASVYAFRQCYTASRPVILEPVIKPGQVLFQRLTQC
ncbi:hypothetical protein KIW84_075366 [Lathyrus oleraceus]|uniref:Translation elongation factor EFG/EF2 domain-containing protein n=1 Tax=Pisum sativum TaxID=3888 RepID=A0A9D4VTI7_PEA|nr:hypothetical protein KIW84_075366 [Pisum sativum]